MKRILNNDDVIHRPYLIEFDDENPSPYFSKDLLMYIRSLPKDLSEKALNKLRATEWFVLNRNSGALICCAVPGLRVQQNIGVVYIKRFSSDPFHKMMDSFLECIPENFPTDQANYFNLPTYRLTLPSGDRFYPVKYNNDLRSWKRRVSFGATRCNTDIAQFENGLLTISNGQRVDLGDLRIDWVEAGTNLPDW